ncbi:endonuclease/exonuclease/phosphatase family protein [Streptomyces sp. Ru72]|uniref:endonuclease/exonuclease/phosphatase family protein n=1 Tax=Streptomyces sp. Ru72 TaxID=2080747 RepID=UPI0015E326B4
MRVVTWNVWGCFGPCRDRAPRLLDTLATLRPDIVCLQETWSLFQPPVRAGQLA